LQEILQEHFGLFFLDTVYVKKICPKLEPTAMGEFMRPGVSDCNRDPVVIPGYNINDTILQCVSKKTSPTFLAVTRESIVGFS